MPGRDFSPSKSLFQLQNKQILLFSSEHNLWTILHPIHRWIFEVPAERSLVKIDLIMINIFILFSARKSRFVKIFSSSSKKPNHPVCVKQRCESEITMNRSQCTHDWVTSQTNADDEAESQINQHQVTFPATRERIITSTQKLICQSVVSQTRWIGIFKN